MGQALGTVMLEGSLHIAVKSFLPKPALRCSFPFSLLPSLLYWFLLGDPTPDRPLCRAAALRRLCPEVGQWVSPSTYWFPDGGEDHLASVAWSAQPCCRKWEIWFLTPPWPWTRSCRCVFPAFTRRQTGVTLSPLDALKFSVRPRS